MTEPMRVDRDVDAWLSEGPATAPHGLLESSLAASARRPQRPRWLAMALGAPTLSTGPDVPRLAPRLAIVIALLLATTITAILIGAGTRGRTDLITVVPTASVGLDPSPSAGPSPTPRVTLEPVATYRDPDTTFSVTAQRTDPWRSIRKSAPNTLGVSTTVFKFDDCPDGTILCLPDGVTVNVAHLGDTLPVHLRDGTEGQIEAASLEDFAASWQALIPSVISPTTVSGWDAMSVTGSDPNPFGGGNAAIYVVESNKVVLIQTAGPAAGRNRLTSFLYGFRLLNEAPTVYRSDELGFEISAIGAGAWSRVFEGMYGAGVRGAGSPSASFWFGNCVDNLCPGYVTVAGGTIADGVVVSFVFDDGATDFRELRVTGQTLDELEASWTAAFGKASSFEPTTVDGAEAVLARSPTIVGLRKAVAVLTIANGRVLAFIAHAPAFRTRIDENRMLSFVTRVTLLP